MPTGRFLLLAVLLTFGFGVLPLEDGPWRTAGKTALVLAAAVHVQRPENRRRLRTAAAEAATTAADPAPAAARPWLRPGQRRALLFGLAAAAGTATVLMLAVFDGARLREIFSLLDLLLRYAEVDAYLWLVSLALAGRSWRLELNRTRALRGNTRHAASSTAVD